MWGFDEKIEFIEAVVDTHLDKSNKHSIKLPKSYFKKFNREKHIEETNKYNRFNKNFTR